jgi:hypothetical protein
MAWKTSLALVCCLGGGWALLTEPWRGDLAQPCSCVGMALFLMLVSFAAGAVFYSSEKAP